MCVRRAVVFFGICAGMTVCDKEELLAQSVPLIRREPDTSHDILLTLQARKLLLADPELGPMNIGVMVNNRVVTLWGPIPAPEWRLRAELCLRPMIDLADIRNELFVSEDPDSLRTPLKIDRKPLLQPDQMPPPLPKEVRSLPGAPGLLMRNEISTTKHKSSPLPVLGLPQRDEHEPSGVVTVELESDRELIADVRKVLQSKLIYRDLQFAVKEGRVYLRASPEDSDALPEAARAIARVPNVVGVVLLQK